MGSIFQSEIMTLCQFFISSETVYNCVAKLGDLGLVQFRDLNPNVSSFQRKFANEVKRCNEVERVLTYLDHEVTKDDITIDEMVDVEVPKPRELIDLEAILEKLETEVREVNRNAETMKRNHGELLEIKSILNKTEGFFDKSEMADIDHDLELEPETGRVNHETLRSVAGVVALERLPAFERMLWRVCRGNAFFRQSVMEELVENATTGELQQKATFIIFYQGEQLQARVKKICDGFRATCYPCPEKPAERREMLIGVTSRLEDLETVLRQTREHRFRILQAAAKKINNWRAQALKVKAIYTTLNEFNLDVTNQCLIGEGWLPTADMNAVQMALQEAAKECGSSFVPVINAIVTKSTPPTFLRTNKFTSGFQNLINAYGIPAYREVNPALYTVATFPLLFAVMFGDAGHGLIMTIFALFLVLNEKKFGAKKIKNEIASIFFGGRYIVLMMGISSMYTGMIYNDAFSKSFNIFGSSWRADYDNKTIFAFKSLMLDPADNITYSGYSYPFGMDPVWQLAENKIVFLNAYKMKISVLIGVLHMTFGVMLSIWNNTYFKNKIFILVEFLPQMIFFMGLFGYLCFLIVYKWWVYSASSPDVTFGSYCAPSLLILFIGMVLMKKPDEPPPVCRPDGYMFDNQATIQLILLFSALICIPIMLLGKPFVLRSRNNKAVKHQEDQVLAGEGGGSTVALVHDGEHEEEFEFSEIMIHQSIHTIEYVLGSVSHTASYLRLWALSLAHAQLSEVLWTMVLRMGLTSTGYTGAIMLYLVFAFWASATLAILLIMEGLSAFLHTLRLHWMEFQSKFYAGTGVLFVPFSFKHVLEEDPEQ